MEATDSKWSAFLVWPFLAALLYGFIGLALHHWTARLAFGFDIAVLAGYVVARINNEPDVKPQHQADWLIAPIIAGLIAAALMLAIQCPPCWLVSMLPLIIAGYAAGDPAFGNSLTLFFLDRILPYPALFVVWVILSIGDSLHWLKTHKRIVAFRMLAVCLCLSYVAMLYGWYTYDLRFVAIGLGFLLGQIGASGGYTASGFTRFAFTVSGIISLLRLSPHVHEVLPSDPMYALAAGFVALTLTTLENPERRVSSK